MIGKVISTKGVPSKSPRDLVWEIVFETLRGRLKNLVVLAIVMVVGAGISLLPPILFKFLIDVVILQRDGGLLVAVLFGLVVTPCIAMALTLLELYLRAEIGEFVDEALRLESFKSVMRGRVSAIEELGPGGIVHTITRDCGRIGEVYIATKVLPFAASCIVFMSTFAMMFSLNANLASLGLIAYPLSYGLGKLVEKRSHRIESNFTQLLSEGDSFLHEVIRGIRAVKAFIGYKIEVARWYEWLRNHHAQKARMRVYHDITLNLYSEFIKSLAIGGVYGLGVYFVFDGDMTIGGLVAFAAYLPRAYSSLKTMMSTQIGLQQARVSADRIGKLMALRPEQYSGYYIPRERAGPLPVAFENVSFRYGRGDAGLKDVTFRIPAGNSLGIVGESGSGKSTILDVLLGFYMPSAGHVCVGDLKTTNWNVQELRKEIGVVPQEVFLWNTSIEKNLTYGLKGVSENAIIDVLNEVQLSDFVRALPEGLSTVVGERGQAVSIGERQRIGIARALLRGAKVLAFDEPTSALDTIRQMEIIDAIKRVMPKRTVIIVSHVISTVLEVDEVIVLSAGRVVEKGPIEKLIAERGLFWQLANAQGTLRSFELG